MLSEIDRRQLLGRGGMLAFAATYPTLARAADAPQGTITGKGPGDFDFLTGEWRIANRRLKDGTTDQWEEFPGEATVFSVMSGQVSIEELRIPVGSHRGMGLRVWRPKEKKWTDHWTIWSID
jgi:hypothetical protein